MLGYALLGSGVKSRQEKLFWLMHLCKSYFHDTKGPRSGEEGSGEHEIAKVCGKGSLRKWLLSHPYPKCWKRKKAPDLPVAFRGERRESLKRQPNSFLLSGERTGE